jgi:hypothetical protein
MDDSVKGLRSTVSRVAARLSETGGARPAPRRAAVLGGIRFDGGVPADDGVGLDPTGIRIDERYAPGLNAGAGMDAAAGLGVGDGLDDGLLVASVIPRFAVARHGYDRVDVDRYIDEIHTELINARREIEQLHARLASRKSEIQAEIERLGAQTSAILITAQSKASETVSIAEVEGKTRIAESAAYAAALREQTEIDRRRVEFETETLRRERDRLLSDVRSTAAALATLGRADRAG